MTTIFMGLAGYQLYLSKQSVCKTLEKKPNEGLMLQTARNVVEREDVLAAIKELVFKNGVQDHNGQFGIILGPSGTGKTYLTRLACCDESASGVVYFEIKSVKLFPKELAHAFGLKLEGDKNFLDVLLQKISQNYSRYCKLPEDYCELL